jgi:hypothetical protein
MPFIIKIILGIVLGGSIGFLLSLVSKLAGGGG